VMAQGVGALGAQGELELDLLTHVAAASIR